MGELAWIILTAWYWDSGAILTAKKAEFRDNLQDMIDRKYAIRFESDMLTSIKVTVNCALLSFYDIAHKIDILQGWRGGSKNHF